MSYEKFKLTTYSAIMIFNNINGVKKLLSFNITKGDKSSVFDELNLDFNINNLLRIHKDRMLMLGRFGRAIKNDIFKLSSATKVTILDFPLNPFNLKEFKQHIISTKPWRNNDIYWKGITQEHIDKYYKTSYHLYDLQEDLKKIKKVLNL